MHLEVILIQVGLNVVPRVDKGLGSQVAETLDEIVLSLFGVQQLDLAPLVAAGQGGEEAGQVAEVDGAHPREERVHLEA